jgi:hypothetical protein
MLLTSRLATSSVVSCYGQRHLTSLTSCLSATSNPKSDDDPTPLRLIAAALRFYFQFLQHFHFEPSFWYSSYIFTLLS